MCDFLTYFDLKKKYAARVLIEFFRERTLNASCRRSFTQQEYYILF